MDDLWPEEFGEEAITPPVSILKEQADLLGKKTGGLVGALVNSRSKNGGFVHEFYLTVPTLDEYSYFLFRVFHEVLLYPVEIISDSTGSVRANDPNEFVDALRKIFQSSEVRLAVLALKATAKATAKT